jgi:integrase
MLDHYIYILWAIIALSVIFLPKMLYNPKKNVEMAHISAEPAPDITYQRDIEPDLLRLRSYLRNKKGRVCTDSYIKNQISNIKAVVGCSPHIRKGGWPSEHDTFGLDYSEEWVEKVRDGLEGKIAPGTINNYMKSIENLFNANGHPIHVARIKIIDNADTAPYECLTKDDVMDIIRAARQNIRDKTILWTLWGSAIRAGECCSLLVDDFKIDDQGRGKILVRHGSIKGKKTRVIPLEPDATLVLREWLKYREIENLSKTEFPALFPDTVYGHAIEYYTISQLMKKYGKAAGYEDAHCHSLRHARCSHWLNKDGLKITVVQKLMGHAHIETTMRYCHTNQDDIDNAIYGLSQKKDV